MASSPNAQIKQVTVTSDDFLPQAGNSAPHPRAPLIFHEKNHKIFWTRAESHFFVIFYVILDQFLCHFCIIFWLFFGDFFAQFSIISVRNFEDFWRAVLTFFGAQFRQFLVRNLVISRAPIW